MLQRFSNLISKIGNRSPPLSSVLSSGNTVSNLKFILRVDQNSMIHSHQTFGAPYGPSRSYTKGFASRFLSIDYVGYNKMIPQIPFRGSGSQLIRIDPSQPVFKHGGFRLGGLQTASFSVRSKKTRLRMRREKKLMVKKSRTGRPRRAAMMRFQIKSIKRQRRLFFKRAGRTHFRTKQDQSRRSRLKGMKQISKSDLRRTRRLLGI